eukprot:1157585-Pelagomonas_calceolata.AAC.2
MVVLVIREVYAPGLGLWLSDYPFIDKSAFLDVSLQIENERQADAERTVDIEAVWEDEQNSAAQPGPSEGAADDLFSQRSDAGKRPGSAACPERGSGGATMQRGSMPGQQQWRFGAGVEGEATLLMRNG